jgi:hypothetical protein
MLPATFLALLSEFRPFFTKPSFANFQVLVAGFVHALSKHRISDAIRAAGSLAGKHKSADSRFFSRGAGSLDALGLSLLAVVLRLLGVVEVERVLDDTLTHPTGKKVALGTLHADPVLRQGGRPFVSYGHVFVTLSVHVKVPWLAPTGWALPFLFRLYEGSRVGGRADAPSDRRRAHHRRRRKAAQRQRVRKTDQKVVRGKGVACAPRPDEGPLGDGVRPTQLLLLTEMLLLVARRFPTTRFRVLADHLYAGNAVPETVHTSVNNMSFVMSGQPDAALYALPAPRKDGQKGRPRTRGERLPSWEAWAAKHPEAFETAEVEMYGETVKVRVASMDGMAYRSLPGRLLRYVGVVDPLGIYRTQYLLSTDLSLVAVQVVAAYARRWPL